MRIGDVLAYVWGILHYYTGSQLPVEHSSHEAAENVVTTIMKTVSECIVIINIWFLGLSMYVFVHV